MSWNLLICGPEKSDGLAPLGNLEAVKAAFDSEFKGMEWETSTDAIFQSDIEDFRLELAVRDGIVQDAYTHGGFTFIRQFAALCKREGWGLADAQEGEAVDLDDPAGWYKERGSPLDE